MFTASFCFSVESSESPGGSAILPRTNADESRWRVDSAFRRLCRLPFAVEPWILLRRDGVSDLVLLGQPIHARAAPAA